MSKFFVSGSSVNIVSDEDIIIKNDLPVGTYYVKASPGGLYLSKTFDMEVPEKIYGHAEADARKIVQTFNDKKQNMGVLLSGLKGTGKTCTAKLVSKLMMAQGMPTIIVADTYNTYALAQFLQRVQTSCMIMFDEFDKLYGEKINSSTRKATESEDDMEKPSQDGLLGLLDGVQSVNHLCMFMCNKKSMVNEYLINRPSRIYYHFQFKGLTEDVIRDYAEKNLIDQAHTEGVVKIRNLVFDLSFDILKSIVEEVNRYGVEPSEAIKVLNIVPATDPRKYDISMINTETGQKYDTDTFCSLFNTQGIRVEIPVRLLSLNGKGKFIDDPWGDGKVEKCEKVWLKEEHFDSASNDAFVYKYENVALTFTPSNLEYNYSSML